ncbi:MAG: hypothetical protein VBE63_15390 [Lamprobacter sp.]|uniref:hypothetical protein n=1 Tax=Lamprobacter sp. TaxID=3100796 RepID=UPI002B25DD94|nr:hypothetical protein [Lamprobacter sp.]MEA3641308.1 hypothetical protein [Lamprobacter sp.]
MSIARVNRIESVDGAPVRFPNGINTAPEIGLIGTPGTLGFGVGAYPNSARFGLYPLNSAEDMESDTYGNYQANNGSVFVFVPKFYYRYASTQNPTYATYGLNSIDIAGTDRFVNKASANAAGYAMPRAFIDGGRELDGFFYFKYFASRDGNTVLSLPNRSPISLTTDANYTRSSDMTDCTGILADAVTLARTVVPGFSHATSIFQRSALALLSLAHGQAATSAAHCAWYDASNTTNFPKGCNDNSLGDTNDAEVIYVTAGDTGNAAKPLTGSGAPFSKTTHNGQPSGIADLNGSMWEVLLGITAPGTSATDSTQRLNGDVYALKESVALANLLAGWTQGGVTGDANNAWGDATHLATLYDAKTALLPWADEENWQRFGNGSNQVFDEALSGDGWLRTNSGIPQDTDGISAGGTNLFGVDGCYRYNRANVFPLGGGNWYSTASAGVFARYWSSPRSSVTAGSSFRAAVPAFGQ